MQGFNEGPFNQCVFNAGPECILEIGEVWVLYLNPDDPVLIASGSGVEIPPNLMFPGQRYKLVKVIGSLTLIFNFRTPPAIVYDSMGG